MGFLGIGLTQDLLELHDGRIGPDMVDGLGIPEIRAIIEDGTTVGVRSSHGGDWVWEGGWKRLR